MMKELSAHKKEVEREAAAVRRSLKSQVKAADKATLAKEGRQKRKRAQSKDVYNAIGFDLMFDETGICQVEDGVFSQTVDFSDVSYQSADRDSQEAILDQYATVFDGCGPEVDLQVTVINTPVPERQIGHKEFFRETGDAQLDRYVAEYNEVLNRKMMEGVSNIERNRFITYAVKAPTYEEALPKLRSVYSSISNSLERMGSATHRLSGTERLGVISSLLRPFHEYSFDYQSLLVSGLTAKDSVCPMSLDFAPDGLSDLFKSDGTWCQALVIREIGAQLEDLAVSELVDLPIPMCVSMHIHPLDKNTSRNLVRRKLVWIDKDITERQQKAVRKGYDYENLPQELKYSKADTEDLLNELQYENQKLYEFTAVIYTYAKSFEDLRGQAVEIIRTASVQGLEVDVLECQQREALNTVLPLASNHIGATRRLTTTQVAMFIPFATSELNQENGGYYGQNQVSHNLVMMNRRSLAAPMGWVFGQPGSGKSFGVKREITNTYLTNPKAEFIIIDPKDEYSLLVKALGGTAFNLEMNSPDRINIFDFYDGTESMLSANPIDYKSETIQAAASVVMGTANNGLTPIEKTIIDRCVRLTYARCPEGRFPKIEDFHRILLEQEEPEAARLATSFELFVTGSQRYFNSDTTVVFDKRITSFSFQKISETTRVFAMILIMDYVYNRMLYNFKRGVQTWLYIDEVQSLFTTPTVIEYFDKFWAEGRSYNMIPTAITQTPERVINHDIAKYLIRNSDFIMLYKLAPADRITMSELLNLSPQQQQAIGPGAQPGEGLLIAGASTIPFEDEWPEGPLYELWDTKPENLARKNEAEWIRRQQQTTASATQSPAAEAGQPRPQEAVSALPSTPAPVAQPEPAPVAHEPVQAAVPVEPEAAEAEAGEAPGEKSPKELLREYFFEHPEASYAELGRVAGVARSTATKWAKEVEKEFSNKDRVRMFFARNPKATRAEAAKALGISTSTVGKWLKSIKDEPDDSPAEPAGQPATAAGQDHIVETGAPLAEERREPEIRVATIAPQPAEPQPEATPAAETTPAQPPVETPSPTPAQGFEEAGSETAEEERAFACDSEAEPAPESPEWQEQARAAAPAEADSCAAAPAQQADDVEQLEESSPAAQSDEERVLAFFKGNAGVTAADAAKELGMHRRTVKRIARKLEGDRQLTSRRGKDAKKATPRPTAEEAAPLEALKADEATWHSALAGANPAAEQPLPAQAATPARPQPARQAAPAAAMPVLALCPVCGKAINATATFCEHCGSQIGTAA